VGADRCPSSDCASNVRRAEIEVGDLGSSVHGRDHGDVSREHLIESIARSGVIGTVALRIETPFAFASHPGISEAIVWGIDRVAL
jgi:hypothetical protein